eukprot:TRINITY_DN29682_c0_g1_i1.p1 TRINITY_DN29682_c0_g1~~TRINITY_DN29682_c0_g1_i1.p1  ORF type:complete len:140 (-),score=20.63 TRINITY_DN29682_c0_g1_i1:336-755(-)
MRHMLQKKPRRRTGARSASEAITLVIDMIEPATSSKETLHASVDAESELAEPLHQESTPTWRSKLVQTLGMFSSLRTSEAQTSHASSSGTSSSGSLVGAARQNLNGRTAVQKVVNNARKLKDLLLRANGDKRGGGDHRG